jgi:ABC-type transport system involved in cytochrome c biogenesis permease subunit
MAGFVLHTISLVASGIRAGNFPVNNLHETLSVTAWAIAAVFLAFFFKYNLKVLGIYAAPLITLIMITAYQMPQANGPRPTAAQELVVGRPYHHHLFGQCRLCPGLRPGRVVPAQENAIKKKTRGFFFSRLPSLDLLDTTGYACIVVGFSMITIGLITGVVYAKAVWGRFWSWDPKEVWSAITWLFYAVLLHERLTVGWRGDGRPSWPSSDWGYCSSPFLASTFCCKATTEPLRPCKPKKG